MTMIYKGKKCDVRWRQGFNHSSTDVIKVVQELNAIGDDIAPDEIVEFARTHPKAEMHKCFTWYDGEAAEKYRKHEARNMVNSIEVEIISEKETEGKPISLNYFTSVSNPLSDDGEGGRAYIKTFDAANDADQSDMIYADFERYVQAAVSKLNNFRRLVKLNKGE